MTAMSLAPDSWYLHFHLLKIAVVNSDKPVALKAFRRLDKLVSGDAVMAVRLLPYPEIIAQIPDGSQKRPLLN